MGAHRRQLQKSQFAPEWVKDLDSDQTEPPPEALAWQWGVFCELHDRRRGGFSGPEPISDLDLLAWQQNTGMRLRAWEARLVFDLDSIYRQTWHDRSSDT